MRCSNALVLLLPCIFMSVQEVHSRIIFDKVRNVAGKVKCGLHKVGTSIWGHEHINDPCEMPRATTEQPTTIIINEINSHENHFIQKSEELEHERDSKPNSQQTDNNNYQHKDTPVSLSTTTSKSTSSSIPQIDVRAKDDDKPSTTESSSSTEYATVPNGKRLIQTGSNCPPDFVSDGEGNCRQEA